MAEGFITPEGGLNIAMPQINAAQAIQTMATISVIIIGAIIAGILLWIIYNNFIRHKIKVFIIDTNRRILQDKARIVTEDGIKKIKLMKFKDFLKPVERRHFFLAGRSDALLFIKPLEGDLIPQTVATNPHTDFITVDQDVRFWAQQERKAKFKKYMLKESALAKYMPIIGMIVAIGLIAVLFIVTLDKFEQVTKAIYVYADAIRNMPSVIVSPTVGG